jgi:hypothetical protein
MDGTIGTADCWEICRTARGFRIAVCPAVGWRRSTSVPDITRRRRAAVIVAQLAVELGRLFQFIIANAVAQVIVTLFGHRS